MINIKIPKSLGLVTGLLCVFFQPASCLAENNLSEVPNIVIILADDMGYGDSGVYNPQSKIATPQIDKLAQQGLRFTDAHSAGATCIPSRYGLITGRYPYQDHYRFIEPDQLTLPAMLKQQGYNTAMVGKWHLGFDNFTQFNIDEKLAAMPRPLPALTGGPVDRGFDSYFGMWASLDIPPYFYIRDRKIVNFPSERIAAKNTNGWTKIQGEFWREGGISSDFKHEEVLPKFTEESIKVIDRLSVDSKKGNPFFLYFAMTGPHTPWSPAKEFRGKSQLGLYGDFVMQVDDTLGRVMQALERNGVSDNTLVIFTSDNGPVWYEKDRETRGHSAAGILRGMKADSWEGSNRMPFIVRWPGKVKASSVSSQLFSFTDMMATFADLTSAQIPDIAELDSVSILPALLGEVDQPLRDHLYFKETVIRKGPWKLINHLASDGFTQPRSEKKVKDGPQGQLYNLDDDPSERNNLWLQHPDIVADLTTLMQNIQQQQKTVDTAI